MSRGETSLRVVAGRSWGAATFGNTFDLALVLGFGLALPFWVSLPSAPAVFLLLKIPVAVIAMLVAPGFALVAALFPKRDDLDGLSRAALSSGLSIASVALLVLLLGAGEWRIRPGPVAVSLALWIEFFGALALWRRLRLGAAELVGHPWMPDAEATRSGAQVGRRCRRWNMELVALLGVAAFAGITVLSIDRPARTTEFYLLGEGGHAENYPRRVSPGQELAATVGIVNNERKTRTYRVEVWAVDMLDQTRQGMLFLQEGIALDAGERREQLVRWRSPDSGDEIRIEFRLFRTDDQSAAAPEHREAYRLLNLVLDAVQQS